MTHNDIGNALARILKKYQDNFSETVSGDSGTLKKFKQYGSILKEKGFRPVLLFLREDNLPAAINACKKGGWLIYTGQATFDYLREKTGFDLYAWLDSHKDKKTFFIDRGDV